jgi:uncharacterized membrane protein (DUF2068 family)
MRRANLAFRVVLSLLAAANCYGFVLGLTRHQELVAQWPRLASLWPVYVSCPVVTLIALGALWARRRWGFWLAIGVAAAVFGIELYACGPSPHIFRVPVATALLVLAIRPTWKDLS